MSEGPRSDEYNILDLDPAEAKSYVVAVMATLKQTAAKRIQLERDLDLWRRRVDLAVEKGRNDLIDGAQRKVTELAEDVARLRAEEAEYTEGISRMRAQLRTISNRPAMTVDVDLLTAQMDMLIGEQEKAQAETTEHLKQAQAEMDLEALKRRMNEKDE
jgi:phage shock protein A